MHKGQEQFLNFILACIENEHRETAIALLEESFTRQAQGTVTKTYLDGLRDHMLGLVKQEKYNDVKQTMETFNQAMYKK